ncbi:hypothetical protein HGG70_07375 [Rhodobacteraceae bacterium R_SAG4]|nr:hypothetical protein [Rhodobacteraceae bacterium R_SAG4]
MTDKTIVSASIFDEAGEFFFTLEDGASRVGPYATQELAEQALSDLLEQSFTRFAEEALFGK